MTKTDLLNLQPTLIGCMVIDSRCVGPVLAELAPEDFYTPVYRLVYDAIRSLFHEGAPVDPVTVLERIGNQQQYRDLILQCMEMTPTAAHCMEYVKLQKKDARLHRCRELAQSIIDAEDEDEMLSAIAALNAGSVERTGTRIVSMSDMYWDFFKRHGEQLPPSYLSWKFPAVNRRLFAQSGDMIVLGGYPSAGKTALAAAFACHQAEHHRVGFFSFETSAEKLHDRTAAFSAAIDSGHIKLNRLTDAEWERYAQLQTKMTDMHLDIIEASGKTVQDIWAISLSRRYEIIYIDYLQKIRPDKSRRNSTEYESISRISDDLQQMARQTGITVVALSQLKRPDSVRADGTTPRPTLSSLRSSGQIEQDADAVMLLYLEDTSDKSGRRYLQLAKNKDGEADVAILLDFDGPTMTFSKDGGKAKKEKKQKPPEEPQLLGNYENLPLPFGGKEDEP